jgi:hypothetical protein
MSAARVQVVRLPEPASADDSEYEVVFVDVTVGPGGELLLGTARNSGPMSRDDAAEFVFVVGLFNAMADDVGADSCPQLAFVRPVEGS